MKFVLWGVLILVLSACSTVSVQVPATRFVTPESQGERSFKGRVRGGLNGGSEIELIQDKYSATPDSDPVINIETGAHTGLDMNIIPGLDVYGIINYNSYLSVGLKYQILGNSVKLGKRGDFSLAVGGGGLGGGGLTNSESTSSGVTVKDDSSFSGYEYFLLLGFRPHDRWLFYAGPWMTEWELETKLERTEAGVTTITADLKGEGSQQSVVVGLQFGRTFQLNVEGAFTKTEYKKTHPTLVEAESREDFVYGATFGFAW